MLFTLKEIERRRFRMKSNSTMNQKGIVRLNKSAAIINTGCIFYFKTIIISYLI